jgi:hypothetical protein
MTAKSKLRILLLILSFLNFFPATSQDFIKKNSGELLKVKIQDMNLNDVLYKPFDDLNATNKSISKTEISEIKFENGRNEYFGVNVTADAASIEDTKQFIINEINNHGYDPGTFDKRFQASFEGDYLRLTILKKNGEPTSDSMLYDFANVYRFSGVDRRSDDLAFINIFVSYLKSEKNNKWDKMKITMRVDSDTRAESTFNALKHYHSLLTKKENGDSKF